MTLYMVGLGLYDMADITLRGLEVIRNCDTIYLEYYTAVLHTSKEQLETFFKREIIIADRHMVENHGDKIVQEAKHKDIAFLVVGDPFGATTHADMFLRARKEKVHIEVIHNASILTAVGVIGLELYKYGRTTTLVFDDEWLPTSPLEVIEENLAHDLHTLCLLDIKVAESSKEDLKQGKNTPQKPRFQTVNQGIAYLRKAQEKYGLVIPENKIIIGAARLGATNGEPKIVAGTMTALENLDFGNPMHSIIIPANKLHDIEQEMIEQWM